MDRRLDRQLEDAVVAEGAQQSESAFVQECLRIRLSRTKLVLLL